MAVNDDKTDRKVAKLVEKFSITSQGIPIAVVAEATAEFMALAIIISSKGDSREKVAAKLSTLYSLVQLNVMGWIEHEEARRAPTSKKVH